MGIEAIAAVALSAASAVSGVMQARTQAAGLMAQATQARLVANQRALEAREEGVAALQRIVRTNATINARAGAGGIDPFSGSAGKLMEFAMGQGALEFYSQRDAQTIEKRTGELQAQQYKQQARGLMTGALISAVTKVAGAGLNAGLLGGPPAGGGYVSGGMTALRADMGGNVGPI